MGQNTHASPALPIAYRQRLAPLGLKGRGILIKQFIQAAFDKDLLKPQLRDITIICRQAFLQCIFHFSPNSKIAALIHAFPGLGQMSHMSAPVRYKNKL